MQNIHVITDCCDENARLRQVARYGAYFPRSNIFFAGASSDIEAAFLLVDTLDALDGSPGVIMVNVAPRHGVAKKHANGTPFGMIQVGEATVFASVDGNTLRLIKQLKPDLSLCIYDIPEVVPHLTEDVELQQKIISTQFRSFEFLPRVAKAVMMDGRSLPGNQVSLADHCGENSLDVVAFVDCFGNLKTTILPEDLNFECGQFVKLEVGATVEDVMCYSRLKDIPNDELGLTIGSSGLGKHRFMELMVQGKSAAAKFGAKVGTSVRLIK